MQPRHLPMLATEVPPVRRRIGLISRRNSARTLLRGGTRGAPSLLLLFLQCLAGSVEQLNAADQPAPPAGALPSREQLVQHHRKLESLAFTCQARVDVEVVPTHRDDLLLIREVIALKRHDATPQTYQQYVFDSSASDQSFTALWFRDGAKERFEFYPIRRVVSGRALAITVNDGKDVRNWWPINGAGRAPREAGGGRWSTSINPNPFKHLHHEWDWKISEFLRQASRVEIASTDENGMAFRATAVDSRVPDSILEIGYDADWRPVRRDVIRKISNDREPRVYERHDFVEWQAVKLKTGASTEIPTRIVISNVVGIGDDGLPATYRQEIIQLSEVQFNVELSEELFLPSPPPADASGGDRREPD